MRWWGLPRDAPRCSLFNVIGDIYIYLYRTAERPPNSRMFHPTSPKILERLACLIRPGCRPRQASIDNANPLRWHSCPQVYVRFTVVETLDLLWTFEPQSSLLQLAQCENLETINSHPQPRGFLPSEFLDFSASLIGRLNSRRTFLWMSEV